jgi:hypothetical protein
MPEWKIFKDFNYNDRAGALAFDASLGSHALSNFQPGPWSPGEIGSMFDSISCAAPRVLSLSPTFILIHAVNTASHSLHRYDKGGTVLRMANSWLTGQVTNPPPSKVPNVFMDSLRAYLKLKQ